MRLSEDSPLARDMLDEKYSMTVSQGCEVDEYISSDDGQRSATGAEGEE